MRADGLELAGDLSVVPDARRFVLDRLARWGMERLADDVGLAVTELLTNGLLHAGPPVRLVLRASDETVRVEVHDPSRVAPVRPVSGTQGMTGRGLALVNALAERWGVERTDRGKAVWAELTGRPMPAPDRVGLDVDAILAAFPDEPDDAAHPEPRYRVTLGDVPTGLLIAAKTHLDGLVRELTLMASGGSTGVSSPPPPPMAALVEAVTSQFAEARGEIKRQAVAAAARGDVRTGLTLTLPLSAAQAGERYLAALDSANNYARSMRLLTMEEPPPHRAFRHWYVTALAQALREAAGGPPAHTRTFEEFLLDEVDRLAALQQVSDRVARLQRVTGALTAATTATEVGDVVLAEAADGLRARRAVLLLPDGDDRAEPGGTRVASRYGRLPPKPVRYPPGAVSPGLQALRTGEPVWVESVAERDAGFPAMATVEPDVVALCAVPLRVGGRTVGVLRLSFAEPRMFDADERSFLTAVAAAAAQSLDRAQLFDEQRRLADRLLRLQGVMADLVRARDVEDVVDVVIRAAEPLGAARGALCLLDRERQILRIALGRTTTPPGLDRWSEFPVAADLPASEAVRTGQIVVAGTVAERDARWPAIADVAREEHALVCLPLIGDDRPVGALSLSFPGTSGVGRADRQWLSALADACAQAVLRTQMTAALRGAHDRLAKLEAASGMAGATTAEPIGK